MPSRSNPMQRGRDAAHRKDGPSGETTPQRAPGGGPNAVELFTELTERVSGADERARLIGVAPELVAAWDRGAAQPLLRAHRKALERALEASAAPNAGEARPDGG